MRAKKGEYEIDTDKRRLDIAGIHKFLSTESYWAKNRALEQTLTAIENSICFGIYKGRPQVGFARVITDRATFAYIGDVFVLQEHRGRGLSKWLMKTIVEQQVTSGYWNVVLQPVGFLIFLICAFAECNRTPFDLPEAENELNFGYHQEYSSMKLGFYLFAEYINMFISSAVMATLFFGGYDIPFVNEASLAQSWGHNLVAVLGSVALLLKVAFFLFFFMWVRWTIPRFRYDQLMDLGWKKLIPLALANMLITGAVILWLNK